MPHARCNLPLPLANLPPHLAQHVRACAEVSVCRVTWTSNWRGKNA